MREKRPLPSCKNCSELSFIDKWICTESGKPINRRHARAVARRCPAYRWWVDALMEPRCFIIKANANSLPDTLISRDMYSECAVSDFWQLYFQTKCHDYERVLFRLKNMELSGTISQKEAEQLRVKIKKLQAEHRKEQV